MGHPEGGPSVRAIRQPTTDRGGDNRVQHCQQVLLYAPDNNIATRPLVKQQTQAPVESTYQLNTSRHGFGISRLIISHGIIFVSCTSI